MITATSRFIRVKIAWQSLQGAVSKVSCWLDDSANTRVFINLTGGEPPPTGSALAGNLAALQQIYASSDGIRDGDGNALDIEVAAYPHGTTIQSLIDHGEWNPLDADSWDRFARRKRALAAFEGLDTDSIINALILQTGLVFHPIGISDDPITVNLAQSVSHVVYDEGRQFQIRVRFAIADEITDYADIRANLKMRVLFGWLNSIRADGDAESDLSAVTNFTTLGEQLTGRSWSDSEGSISVAFESATVSTSSITVGGVVTFIQLGVAVNVSGNAMTSTADLLALFEARDISVSPDETSLVYPTVILPPQIQLGERTIRGIGATAGIEVSGPNGETLQIPFTGRFGVSYPWDDLEGTAITKNFPNDRIVDTVHYNRTGNGTIVLPRPRDLVESNGEYATLSIHNQGEPGYGYCQAVNADADLIWRVYPGEEQEFRAGLNEEGVEEIIAVRPPTRHLKRDIEGDLLPDVADFGRLSWLSAGADTRLYLLDFGETAYWDEDAFDVFDGDHPTGNPDIETGVSNWDFDGVYLVRRDGILDVVAEVGLALGASGTIGTWSGILIGRFRGSTFTNVDYVRYEELSGENNGRQYRARGRLTVEDGDRIAVFLRFRNNAVTIGYDDIEVGGGKLDMWLQPQLVRA